MNKKTAVGGILILGVVLFLGTVFFFISKNKNQGSATLTSTSRPSPPSTDFNTQPTKLIDLSPYDMEKSKKLWSEASYFLFDGKGWLAQVPLMKKGGDQGKIVVGYGKSAQKELTDGYSSISPDGRFAIIEKIERKIGDTPQIQKKYLIEDIGAGKMIRETPFFDDVRAIHFDKNSAFHVVVHEQGNLVWYKDNTPIMSIAIPEQSTPQETEAWIKRSIFRDKNTLAMATNNNGITQVMVNGKIIVPEWKYPDDQIFAVRILATIQEEKVFYVCIGKKNLAFFVDEKETIGNLLSDNSLYLYPFLMGDFSARAAISPDGKKLAIADATSEPFVRVLGENPKVFRKAYPKGSRILEMSFSPDGKQLYYEVETDFNDSPEKSQTYIVLDENEQGPWKWGIRDFRWSSNGEYAYVAEDGTGKDIIIKDGIPIRTIPRYSEGAQFELGQLGFSINPINGKVLYLLEKNTTNYNNTSGEIRSKLVYDEKESREYIGYISGLNWGRDFFSPDGKHLVYMTSTKNKTTGGITIIIDGKEFQIDGDLLGSWGSKDGGFSADSKWFGIYVIKENAVWWIPFDLENLQ